MATNWPLIGQEKAVSTRLSVPFTPKPSTLQFGKYWSSPNFWQMPQYPTRGSPKTLFLIPFKPKMVVTYNPSLIEKDTTDNPSTRVWRPTKRLLEFNSLNCQRIFNGIAIQNLLGFERNRRKGNWKRVRWCNKTKTLCFVVFDLLERSRIVTPLRPKTHPCNIWLFNRDVDARRQRTCQSNRRKLSWPIWPFICPEVMKVTHKQNNSWVVLVRGVLFYAVSIPLSLGSPSGDAVRSWNVN